MLPESNCVELTGSLCRAQIVRELIERFEAHLTAGGYYSVIANMRGGSAEEVAAAILGHEGLRGLQVGCRG